MAGILVGGRNTAPALELELKADDAAQAALAVTPSGGSRAHSGEHAAAHRLAHSVHAVEQDAGDDLAQVRRGLWRTHPRRRGRTPSGGGGRGRSGERRPRRRRVGRGEGRRSGECGRGGAWQGPVDRDERAQAR